MKYLKEFETVSQYESAKGGLILPNVSLVKEINEVAYNPDSVKSITDAVITCDSATYNGEAQIATNIVVTLSGKTLVENTDYTVSGNEGGINASNYTFTVNGIGKYKDSKEGTFTINKVTPTVVIPVAKLLTYQKGVAQELVTAGSTNYGTMKYSTDGEAYSTTVPSKTKAGSYTVYYFVEGDSNVNSTDVATVACSINEKLVTATIELSEDAYTYDGTAKEPTVTVKDGGDIIDPSEYSVTYSNNTNAGTASVTITDNTAGDYNVSGVTTFTINKASRTMSWVSNPSDVISGSSITVEAAPSVGVGDGTITYSSNDTTKATVNDNVVSGVGVGSCTITATISEGTNYLSANTSYSLTVNDYRVVAKYNVASTSSSTQIGYNAYISGFSAIEIDGVVQPSVVSAYTFSTTGEHTVKYTLTDPTSIGEMAFYECKRLTNVTIPNTVASIDSGAFQGCSSLISITIPDSVTSIDYYALAQCTSLSSITVDSSNTTYDSRNNCNAIIETSTNTLIQGCKNTLIPNSVTSIGSRAFYGCSSLISIEIPDSVTSIGSSAFYGCSSITNCTIGSGVTSIGSRAFQGCSSLISITIPDSVTSIGDSAFQGCSSLTSVTIGSGVTSIGNDAFSYCTSLTSIISNEMTAPTIRSYTFRYIKTGGVLTVPSGSSGYNVWMGTGSYYLGKYGWTKVEQ